MPFPLYYKYKSGEKTDTGFNIFRRNLWIVRFEFDDQKLVSSKVVPMQNQYFKDIVSKFKLQQEKGDIYTGEQGQFVDFYLPRLVRQVTVPELSQPEEMTYPMPLFTVRGQQNRYTFNQVTINFTELIGLPVQTFFKLWIYVQMFNPWHGNYGLVEDYKQRMTVRVGYGDVNSFEDVKVWKFFGVFPVSIEQGELQYQNTDQFVTNVTFSIDYFEEDVKAK